MPAADPIQHISLPDLFRLAVAGLVNQPVYTEHEHLLEVIAPPHYLSFLELLKQGIDLRTCFGELDSFLVWQTMIPPALARLGLGFDSLQEQVSLYLLEKKAESSDPWILDWSTGLDH
ncbi:hypothetical protein [Fibrella forsythiae]|uniref:Uncharacterized protein n=1 Tax=Fibrella forsythiae TaxID=2817061 RepID=A0ABS3JSR0_9BACT|nr:hypothetical protein [Fibrella forsythiae]MBO0953046.1 hypothetical protein [Fibrella forsythiae]